MSYDICLKDPVTKKTIELPVNHIMAGGTFRAEFVDGLWRPLPNREAWLSVTYNYAKYYYEATDGNVWFAHDEDGEIEYGIRGLSGKSGAESIAMLDVVAQRILESYCLDGEWISTEREETQYFSDPERLEKISRDMALTMMCRGEKVYKKVRKVQVSEGPSDDYWLPTAGNALKPLYQLKAMAQLRPDGIWEVE